MQQDDFIEFREALQNLQEEDLMQQDLQDIQGDLQITKVQVTDLTLDFGVRFLKR
jgi:hypothetical protein